MNHPVHIIKSDGTKELFDQTKLENSLRRVGASQEDIDDTVSKIVGKMREGMTTSDIYGKAFSLLRRRHAPAAVKYSLRRALFELGPDGFPFERFVARVFRMWGYETATGQMLLGACVAHEMDVVAWKGRELMMAEAKFHNVIGLKSDIKIVLYVRARFDDLSQTIFDYGGQALRLSPKGRFLFTNTKFTDAAIKYGECNSLRMIGWNYPAEGNLHQLIERNGLHPVTCVNSLTYQEKKSLIAKDILTCSDLIAAPGTLGEIGLKLGAADKILNEAKMIIDEATKIPARPAKS